MNQQTPQDSFRLILLTVVGQAFAAAGYQLEDRPMQWSGGLFRFTKRLNDGLLAHIDFQLLSYTNTEWASGAPSRFRVNLSRSDGIERTLSALVVDDFSVAILPSSDHWWTFSGVNELGHGLAEAGHLVVGYGLPWLSGGLLPPSG